MPDHYTEVTRRSWGSNILGALKGIVVGLVLIVIAIPLLWWNEGRTVKTARGLKEGAAAVVDVTADRVNAANEGKLVHLTGQAATGATVQDDQFGISSQAAIALVRTVEMYQWREDSKSKTKSKLGGSTETTTTYDYKREWSTRPIDSSSFKHPEGHHNPGAFPWESRTFTAGEVTLGAFRLSSDLISQMDTREPRPVTSSDHTALPDSVKVAPIDGMYYRGANPQSPQVGDVRVRFEVVKPQVVSVVATQRGSSFEPYPAKSGTTILMLEEGTVSADAMFRAAAAHNKTIAWILRGVGLLVMFIGFVLVFRPLVVVGSFIPFVGSILSAGLGLVSFLVALALTLVTISLAWLAYRPLLGIGLLALALASIVLLVRMRKRAKPVQGQAV